MAQNTDNINLESHRWKSRLILLFTRSEDDPRYQSQIEQFYSQQEQVRDRDIILFELLGKDRRGADGVVSPNQNTDSLWERQEEMRRKKELEDPL
jgi:hypothetical protein